MKRHSGIVFSWLLAVLLPAFAIYPALLHPIEEHGYDAATFHVYRGVVFSAARAEGTLYPRWVQPINAGLGGPLFSFYSPLTYVAMDGLHSLGVPHPVAWRILVALALVAASTGIFALVLSLSGRASGALAASAIYVYSFPFLRELFERGSPEGFAFALYPWALYALVLLIQHPNGLRLAFAALTWSAALLTHNLSALFLIPLFGLLALLFVHRRGRWALCAAALLLISGLLLSAFFVIPFVAERGFVQIDNAVTIDYTRVAENSIPLVELLRLPAPYDLGLGNNLIEDHIGPIQGLLLLTGLVAGPLLWLKRRRWDALFITGLAVFSAVVLWLQTPSADALWKALPFLAYVQARTRLLGLFIVSIATLGGWLVGTFDGHPRTALAYTLAIASLLLAMPVLYPRLQHRYEAFERNPTVDDAKAFSLQKNVPGLTAFNEFLPIWRHLPFTADEAERVARSLFSRLPEGSRIIREERGMRWARAEIESPFDFDTAVHVLYFPGWVGLVDGQARSLKPSEGSGYIQLEDLPAGTHAVTLHYAGTSVQSASTGVSAIAAFTLLLATLVWRSRPSPTTITTYPTPNWWLPVALVLIVGLKAWFLDTRTTLLRRTSSCLAVQGAETDVDVRFGEDLRLCAIDLSDREFKPGDTARITLYWQADDAMLEPVESFVHLLGAEFNPKTGNPLWGQQDKQLPGYHPVTQWTPGKLYRDTYEFGIDPDAPPGEYQLEIGWVEPSTSQRLRPELVQATDDMSVSHLDSLLISGIVLRQHRQRAGSEKEHTLLWRTLRNGVDYVPCPATG